MEDKKEIKQYLILLSNEEAKELSKKYQITEDRYRKVFWGSKYDKIWRRKNWI